MAQTWESLFTPLLKIYNSSGISRVMVDSATNETYKWAEEAARPEGRGLHQQEPSTNMGLNRSLVAHRLPSVQFAINKPRKLRIPILVPYECKCQCNKVYNIYGDHPFHCQKYHKGRPHNMITNRFSQALASLLTLTTANIISPKAILTRKHSSQLHLPSDPTARPFDISYKPNIKCHSSNVFSMIGYDITITTNITTPYPSAYQPRSSIVSRLYYKLHCQSRSLSTRP